MAPQVVGKRYKFKGSAHGWIVGRCVSAKGEFWEFKLETYVAGFNRNWSFGDVMAVRASYVEELEEIPLDAQG